MSASVARIPGVVAADLNFASATLLIEHDAATDPSAEVERVVAGTGHGIQTLEGAAAGEEAPQRSWLDRNLAEVATFGSGAFIAVAALSRVAGSPSAAVTVLYAIAIFFGGLLVWRRAVVSLRARMLDMNVLMTIAVFGAAALGEWGEASTVYFLYALGGLLESRSLERTRRSIRDLMELAPTMARVRRDPGEVEVLATEVLPGELVAVRPGERVPLDGVITGGASALDESPITGESVPVDRSVGEKVYAGSLNTTGLIEVAVTSVAADSTIARIVFMVEEAQAAKAPSQAFVDRFSRYYTPAVIAAAVAIAVVPPALGAALGASWGPWDEWFRRALVMLVVSCPCALVISTPVSIVSGIARATRDGMLVKGGTFLEAAAKVRAVAFDKTGTLTQGRPAVVQVLAFGESTQAEVISMAAALEAHSNHPLAQAVVQAARAGCVSDEVSERSEVTDVKEVPGEGISGVVGGAEVSISSMAAAHARGVLDADVTQAIGEAEELGRTALVVAADGKVRGVIAVADKVRPEARDALAQLRASGVEHLVMLTGDNQRVAEAIASEVGLTGVRARLLPRDKTDAIGELRERYGTVIMVGDGVNDAPALAAADIGIAMGAAGSDTALEVADVALMRDDLSALAGFLALGRRTVSTIRVNVAFSIAIKALFLVLALTGYATLWMAVFADTGVSLLVILNGMRLLAAPRRA